jgi:hypothetical protein
MNMGCEVKLTNRMIRALWPTDGEHVDFKRGCDVGKWLGENQRLLNKSPLDKCCELITGQFPFLTEVEVKDYTGRICRT